ncbi:MAG: MotA/TolQ/ExbB proton channel family protein [Endomicrobium sp.]|jgi:biopolymer transport protein ExbB/TolQ|nr:MotA/TolQ/ExbB proton channel family protein [Endomicrobium sp.]
MLFNLENINILNISEYIFYIILVISIFSVAVICFKIFEFYKKSRIKRDYFIPKLIKKIKEDNIDSAIDFCNSINSPMSSVSLVGLIIFNKKGEYGTIIKAMKREIMIQVIKLEKFVNILGIFGSTVVYVGLLGTVLGIIKAFHNISKVGSGGINVVIGGVSEALIATAASLSVAIPATVAYNIFSRSIEKFIINMEYCISTLEDIFRKKNDLSKKKYQN